MEIFLGPHFFFPLKGNPEYCSIGKLWPIQVQLRQKSTAPDAYLVNCFNNYYFFAHFLYSKKRSDQLTKEDFLVYLFNIGQLTNT